MRSAVRIGYVGNDIGQNWLASYHLLMQLHLKRLLYLSMQMNIREALILKQMGRESSLVPFALSENRMDYFVNSFL